MKRARPRETNSMREAALNVAALRKQAGDLYVVATQTTNIAKVKIYS
jgi:hypothetical protein